MADDAPTGGVLLVDDDDTFRGVLAGELRRRGHRVTTAADGAEAVSRALAEAPDVILLDLRLPDADGLDVLATLKAREVSAGVVVLTGHGTIDTAIRAIRMGAHDYLEKPCPIEKVDLAIQKTREHLRLVSRQRVLQDGYSPADVRAGMVGQSEAFTTLCRTAERVARADSTTLVRGETGVGKELVAKLLHARGPRQDAPFVVVDCASLDEDLLRSELFGHERGAFTGASRLKHGLCEVADGGTLFLDEVGDMSLEIQAKLLRVLETGRFRRIGGTREIEVDIRFVSATNRDLQADAAARRFREDLYFRLSVLTIEVPPLRERAGDVPLLVEHYARRFNRRLGTRRCFGEDALGVLERYAWPGNVRELVHVVEQAIVLADTDEIPPEGLPSTLFGAEEGEGGPTRLLPLREVQRRHVLSVVEHVGGNRARAARLLGISERNLYRLLNRYGRSGAQANRAKGGERPA